MRASTATLTTARCPGLSDGVLRAIQGVVEGHATLEDVVRWGLSQSPPIPIAAVVTQDEYTHDVVLPWSNGVFLVYDTT